MTTTLEQRTSMTRKAGSRDELMKMIMLSMIMT